MQIIERRINSITVEILALEIQFLIKAIQFVILQLDREFSIRVGYEVDEAQAVLKNLKLANASGRTVFELTLAETILLKPVLNEILHGIAIADFEQTFGFNLRDAEKIYVVLSELS